MAQIGVQPRVLKNYLLTFGTDQYEKHVNSVTLTPSASVQTWKGGTPDDVYTDATNATWTLDLAYAQDWATPNSLSRYLFEHEGETVAMSFEPIAEGPSFTANVIVTPGAVGGAIDAFATATVSLGVQGKPVFDDPAAA